MKAVHWYPLGSDFIAASRAYLEAMKIPFNRIAVVFPGKRPALYLKAALAGTRSGPFLPPRCFSMEGFVDHMAAVGYDLFSPLTRPDAVWMLFRAVGPAGGTESPFGQANFSDFYTWGSHLLSFIDALDMDDVPEEGLLAVERNAAVGYDVPERFNALLRDIAAIRKAFHNLLHEARCCTRGLRYLKAGESIEAGGRTGFDVVLFAGVFALTGTERRIIRALWERREAHVLVEGNPEDWPALSKLVRLLGAPAEGHNDGPTQPRETSFRVYSGFDAHSEALHIRSILAGTNPAKTAVVLPLAETLLPVLTFAVDDVADGYNVSLAYPLSRTALFGLAESLLGAQEALAGGSMYAVSDYLAVLLHPFVKNTSLSPAIRHLIGAVKTWLGKDPSSPLYGTPFVSLQSLEDEAQRLVDGAGRAGSDRQWDRSAAEALKRLHDVFFRSFEGLSSLYDGALRLQEAIEFIILHTEIRSYVLSGEIFTRIIDSLEEIKASRVAREHLHEQDGENGRAVRELLRRHLEDLTVPFDTTPLETLEILGLLETRNLRFDRIIIADVNEGVLPAGRAVDPLIPVGLYEGLGMATPEEHEEVFRYYVQRLLAGAREAHLIYVEAEDKPRSRYLEMLLWEREQRKRRLNVVPVERSAQTIWLRTKPPPSSFEKTDLLLGALNGKTLSPSAIDAYIRCPVFFYHRHLLAFEEERPAAGDIDDGDRGTIVHRVLFRTFSGFRNRELKRDDLPAVLAALGAALEGEFEGRVVTGDYYLFRKLTEHKLTSFLSRHLDREGEPLLIAHLEHAVEGPLRRLGPAVRLRGRIDRIDFSPSTGRYTMVDYKTGGGTRYPKTLLNIDPSSMDDIHNSVSSLQLPLYVQLFSELASVAIPLLDGLLLFLRANREESLFKGLEGGEREHTQEHFMEMAATVISHLRNPDIPFAPFDDEACPGCSFRGLCHSPFSTS